MTALPSFGGKLVRERAGEELSERSLTNWLLGSVVPILAAVSALRWTDVSSPLLYAVVPLAPVGLLVSLIVLGVLAFAQARRYLGAATAVIGAWLAIGLLPGSFPPKVLCSHIEAESLVVFSHNVSYESGDPLAVANEITQFDPDVVLLQEADPEFVASVQRHLSVPFPYLTQAASDQTLSLAMLARGPLDDLVDTTEESTDRNPMLFATIELDGQRLAVGNVHLSAPRSSELVARRKAELDYISNSQQEIDILAGDFNSSEAHRDFRTAVEVRGGEVVTRCGIGGTWSPLGRGPGLISLDQVVMPNPQSGDANLRMGGFAGSDHRALVLEL